MTRATYNTDNTLTEFPGEKPNSNDFYRIAIAPGFGSFFDQNAYAIAWAKYNRDVASLRTLVCSPECRGKWAVGQVLEEGKDYEVRPVCIHTGGFEHADCVHPSCDKCAMTAFPLPVKSEQSEEELWDSAIETYHRHIFTGHQNAIAEVKNKYIITKR